MVFAVYPLLLATAVLHLMHYYAALPAKMAVHFDAAGKPNGWMTKDDFALFYLVILAFTSGIFFGVAGVVAAFKLHINIPNRDYWLAKERIDETVTSLKKGMGFIGTMLGVTIIGLHQFLIDTNLNPPPFASTAAIVVFGGMIVATVAGFISWIFIRFRKPDTSI